MSASAKPFLKWAGGKQRLLPQLRLFYPQQFGRYLEPFVGSGAVFFDLRELDRLSAAHLSDSNEELVNCYRIVRDAPDELMALLAGHKRLHSREHYYSVRARFLSEDLTPVQRAARLIYLNKTCFNGLYRVNREGQFNVPMGRYESPAIYDEEQIRAASQALQGTEVAVRHFRECLESVQAGDFLYFDPPYHPVSDTASFTSYTDAGFGVEEQRALADLFHALDRKGCLVMLSNSWTSLVLDLYRGYRIESVQAGRAINSKIDRRGKIREALVLNY
jgi:DNA adenine methylase